MVFMCEAASLSDVYKKKHFYDKPSLKPNFVSFNT